MEKRVITSRWSDPAGASFVVEDPARAEPIAEVRCATPATVDQAVRAAHAASRRWRLRPIADRAAALAAIADAIEAAADELAVLETRENGKPLDQARGDVSACIAAYRFFAQAAPSLHPGERPGGPVALDVVLEPYGVVGGIIPFNWPPIHFGAKTAPALAVGNAVVLKPGEQAPLTVMRLAEIARSVLPEDLIHVVPGRGDVGAALAGHPLVRKLSFTGAPDTGRRVLAGIAPNLTPALMELGGKNPLVIFDDADLDRVLADVVEASFYNKGEACTAASRLLVQRGVHDELVRRLARQVRALPSGDPMAPETLIGPCVTREQAERVRGYIAIGQAEGATVAAAGALPGAAPFTSGHYVAPTLFTGVTRDMRIAREEIFGPVAVVIAFDDEEEAIDIANDTEFGLVAGVYTEDAARARRVARGIEAGVVFVNNYWRGLVGTPFGGTKASGYGREHAVETLREFGYLKAIRSRGAASLPRWPADANWAAAIEEEGLTA